jgi:hypothetical protein
MLLPNFAACSNIVWRLCAFPLIVSSGLSALVPLSVASLYDGGRVVELDEGIPSRPPGWVSIPSVVPLKPPDAAADRH